MNPKANELSDNERYEYLLKQVASNREIWLLQDLDGSFAMFEDAKEQSYIPVWPDKEFAQAYASGDWNGYEPEKMSLSEFLSWTDELKEDMILIGAFPNSQSQSMAIDPIDFKNQLLSYRKKL